MSTTTSQEDVRITAESLLPGVGSFNSWQYFLGNSVAQQEVLIVPANGRNIAVACYAVAQPDPGQPDPCQHIRDELDNLSPDDFPPNPPGLYEKARQELLKHLRACEASAGETP